MYSRDHIISQKPAYGPGQDLDIKFDKANKLLDLSTMRLVF